MLPSIAMSKTDKKNRLASMLKLNCLSGHRALNCYRLRSCLRKVDGGCGKFRPYFLPVVGPQVLPSHGTRRGFFNCSAVFGRNASSHPPVGDGTLNHTNGTGQFTNTTSLKYCSVNFTHAPILITFVIERQHLRD